jgi:hypothetical protein
VNKPGEFPSLPQGPVPRGAAPPNPRPLPPSKAAAFCLSNHAAGSVTNPPDTAAVTINFLPAKNSGQQASSFGPVDAEGSALKLLKEQRDVNNPVLIELSGGEELVIPNTVELLRYYSGPEDITIDGGGRVLRIEEPGALLTVRKGVTLTLRNITLRGMAANNKPLAVVQSGGRLILGDGAVITGNETTANAGGVWVNGGELVMNPGAAIAYSSSVYIPPESMSMDLTHSGGVLVSANGSFTMNGGTIEYCSVGNTNHGTEGGGGVAVSRNTNGIFTMNGGVIQYNDAPGYLCTGGVLGRGTMFGGSIINNTGGYHNNVDLGDFTVYNGTIE